MPEPSPRENPYHFLVQLPYVTSHRVLEFIHGAPVDKQSCGCSNRAVSKILEKTYTTWKGSMAQLPLNLGLSSPLAPNRHVRTWELHHVLSLRRKKTEKILSNHGSYEKWHERIPKIHQPITKLDAGGWMDSSYQQDLLMAQWQCFIHFVKRKLKGEKNRVGMSFATFFLTFLSYEIRAPISGVMENRSGLGGHGAWHSSDEPLRRSPVAT